MRGIYVAWVVYTSFALLLACGSSSSGSKDAYETSEALPQECTCNWERMFIPDIYPVSRLVSVTCRDDALFVAVQSTEFTGVLKFDLYGGTEWVRIFDQAAALTALDKGVAVAFKPDYT